MKVGGCAHCHTPYRVEAGEDRSLDVPAHRRARARDLRRLPRQRRAGRAQAAAFRGDARATCEGCHEDTHAGQFRTGDQPAKACTTCHTTEQWKIEQFDHDKTRYPLEGAHMKLECAKCHPSEELHDGSQGGALPARLLRVPGLPRRSAQGPRSEGARSSSCCCARRRSPAMPHDGPHRGPRLQRVPHERELEARRHRGEGRLRSRQDRVSAARQARPDGVHRVSSRHAAERDVRRLPPRSAPGPDGRPVLRVPHRGRRGRTSRSSSSIAARACR